MVVVVMVVVVAWEYYEIVAGIFKREYSGATVIGVHDLRLPVTPAASSAFLESSTIISVVLVTRGEISKMTSAYKGAGEITSCDISTMTSARLDGGMTSGGEVPTMAFGGCVPRMTSDGKLSVALTARLTSGGEISTSSSFTTSSGARKVPSQASTFEGPRRNASS
jgi:hypothetical protein